MEEFHYNSENCKRDLCIFRLTENLIRCPVLGAHILYGRHRNNKRNLRKKAGKSKRKEVLHKIAKKAETTLTEFNGLHVADIPQGECCSQYLTDNGGHSSAHHAHFHREDEDWVKDNIGYSTSKRCKHSKFRTTV